MMMLQAQIFFDKDELKDTQSLYEYILQFLINQKIKGATVFQGKLGYGESQRLNRPDALFSFDETPMMITFVDDSEKVKSALTALRKEIKSGFIITNQVEKWK
jgi:PII-like signaling protein